MRHLLKINTDELKKIQIEILQKVHTFCKNHNLKYSLAFGTLLGAVRHGGYIPWDDDIDIMMRREDYERFIHCFKDERYRVIYYPQTSGFTVPYAKILDTRTVLIEHSTMKERIGVNIDLFPIDTCPSISEEMHWFKRKHLLDNIYTVRKLRIESERSIFKNLIIIAVRVLTFPLSLATLCSMIQTEATKYNASKGDRKGILSTGDTRLRWMMPAKIFDNYKEISFEDIIFYGIEDTDKYLRATYGDYMKLPPEEKRVSHHGFDAYWK